MNWLRRLRNSLKRFFNRYEAGQPYQPSRSWIPAGIQDARLDASRSPREEIMRKARYFEKNSAIAQRIGSVFGDYVVGPNGMPLTPASSSPEFNAAAKQYWQQSAQFIDLNSRQPFGILQGVLAWRWLFDGEIFILKTRGLDRQGRFQPRIQLVESHRVGTPPELANEEGRTIVDGVAIDPSGRPTGYWMRDDFEGKKFRLVEEQNVIHLFEPSRAGEYRGISMFHAVLNDLHLLDDLEQLEYKAAVDAAEKSTFVKTATGAMPPGLMGGGVPGSGLGWSQPMSDLSEEQRTRAAEIRETVGGRTFALKIGEDVAQFTPNRPTEATRYLWEYLISKVCIGIGIPKLLVIPYSMQGTVVRGDYDVANAYFQSRSAIVAEACRQVYLYVLGWGLRREEGLSELPPDWWNVTIRSPRSVNVDVGRNSAAMLAELAAGATNYEQIYAPLGLDWQEELTKLADQIAFIKRLAEQRGLSPAEIREQMAQTAGRLPDVEQQLAAREQEENINA